MSAPSPFSNIIELQAAMDSVQQSVVRGILAGTLVDEMYGQEGTIVRVLLTSEHAGEDTIKKKILNQHRYKFFWRFVSAWLAFRKDPNATRDDFISHQRLSLSAHGLSATQPFPADDDVNDGTAGTSADPDAPTAHGTADRDRLDKIDTRHRPSLAQIHPVTGTDNASVASHQSQHLDLRQAEKNVHADEDRQRNQLSKKGRDQSVENTRAMKDLKSMSDLGGSKSVTGNQVGTGKDVGESKSLVGTVPHAVAKPKAVGMKHIDGTAMIGKDTKADAPKNPSGIAPKNPSMKGSRTETSAEYSTGDINSRPVEKGGVNGSNTTLRNYTPPPLPPTTTSSTREVLHPKKKDGPKQLPSAVAADLKKMQRHPLLGSAENIGARALEQQHKGKQHVQDLIVVEDNNSDSDGYVPSASPTPTKTSKRKRSTGGSKKGKKQKLPKEVNEKREVQPEVGDADQDNGTDPDPISRTPADPDDTNKSKAPREDPLATQFVYMRPCAKCLKSDIVCRQQYKGGKGEAVACYTCSRKRVKCEGHSTERIIQAVGDKEVIYGPVMEDIWQEDTIHPKPPRGRASKSKEPVDEDLESEANVAASKTKAKENAKAKNAAAEASGKAKKQRRADAPGPRTAKPLQLPAEPEGIIKPNPIAIADHPTTSAPAENPVAKVPSPLEPIPNVTSKVEARPEPSNYVPTAMEGDLERPLSYIPSPPWHMILDQLDEAGTRASTPTTDASNGYHATLERLAAKLWAKLEQKIDEKFEVYNSLLAEVRDVLHTSRERTEIPVVNVIPPTPHKLRSMSPSAQATSSRTALQPIHVNPATQDILGIGIGIATYPAEPTQSASVSPGDLANPSLPALVGRDVRPLVAEAAGTAGYPRTNNGIANDVRDLRTHLNTFQSVQFSSSTSSSSTASSSTASSSAASSSTRNISNQRPRSAAHLGLAAGMQQPSHVYSRSPSPASRNPFASPVEEDDQALMDTH